MVAKNSGHLAVWLNQKNKQSLMLFVDHQYLYFQALIATLADNLLGKVAEEF